MTTTQTVLLDFSIHQERDITESLQIIEDVFNKHLKSVNSCLKLESKIAGKTTTTVTYSDSEDLLVVVRTFNRSRLVTVNIEGPQLCPSGLWSSQAHLTKFVQELHTELGSVSDNVNILPAITRGREVSPYWTTTDDRIVECGIKSVVHEEVSPYQRIQILDTIDFGRLLLLDGQVQLSEADDVYTRSLMAGGHYTGADVLILGGGDGALLAHLLPHQPGHVTMVELDGAVMRAVREHMPAVTRGVLDCHTAANYNIITGDAVKHLAECQENNKQFDYIFGDLTDVPIDTDTTCHTEAETLWGFISSILTLGKPSKYKMEISIHLYRFYIEGFPPLALNCVRPGGSYLTHVSGKAVPATRETFRQTVTEVASKIGRDVNITFSEAFVPSFMETWVFAQITVNKPSN